MASKCKFFEENTGRELIDLFLDEYPVKTENREPDDKTPGKSNKYPAKQGHAFSPLFRLFCQAILTSTESTRNKRHIPALVAIM